MHLQKRPLLQEDGHIIGEIISHSKQNNGAKNSPYTIGDVGCCGSSIFYKVVFLEKALNKELRFIGVENDPEHIKVGIGVESILRPMLQMKSEVNFVCADALDLKKHEKSLCTPWDYAILSKVIVNYDDKNSKKILKNVASCLDKDGLLILLEELRYENTPQVDHFGGLEWHFRNTKDLIPLLNGAGLNTIKATTSGDKEGYSLLTAQRG